MEMEAKLVGVSKGRPTHIKILTVRKSITNVNLLKGKIIAAAGSKEYTKGVLLEMLGEDQKSIVDSLRILIVPKDIDALMAVGFGMADSALTTESSLTKLAEINLKQYRILRQLAASKETLLPIIAAPKKLDENISSLLRVFENMGKTPVGQNKLRMLGMDGWKKLGNAERRFLEE